MPEMYTQFHPLSNAVYRQNRPALDRRWMQADHLNEVYYDSDASPTDWMIGRAEWDNLRFVDRGGGNLISSMTDSGLHRPVLDLDFPHRYVPSSSPGHGHLYLDMVLMDDLQHIHLIDTLTRMSILGKGSKHQILAHGACMVRAPHVKKGQKP